MTTKELGNLGERLACEYLVKKGFSILGRNYRINRRLANNARPAPFSKVLATNSEKLFNDTRGIVSKFFRVFASKFSKNSSGQHYLPSSFGEIDIIARKKLPFWQLFARTSNPIHFVEVKTIVDYDGFFPEQHVDYKKQRKLKNLAQIWLEKNKLSQSTPYQIDIVGILIDDEAKNAKLHYFPNAMDDSPS